MNPSNRLIKEKSPYLLQHAHNPVDWYPWGSEAFEAAKKLNRPVFLSIGYSTCHWCHRMEEESFEDSEIARVLNENYVSIKVDREERPDVDEVYMNAVMSMTGSGGWPLTVFLTPEGKPFFGGTYFPPEDRFGRPGLKQLLNEVATSWRRERQKVLQQSEQLTRQVQRNLAAGERGSLSEEVLHEAYRVFSMSFDELHGGFGHAPKFPTPHNLSLLLRYHYRTKDPRALDMVAETLEAMSMGGMHDHLGGGFHRYSTDEEWFVPHFEKMLYDQALLSRAYLEAYLVTKDQRFAHVARSIFTYVLRDLRDAAGAFYSAEDADSEGYEGKFYLWTPREIEEALGKEAGKLLCKYYDVREAGNFNVQGGHFERGKSILRTLLDTETFARKESRDLDEVRRIVEDSRRKLLEIREKRVRPHRDDKILTDWNGLMISSLSLAARVFEDHVYEKAAKQAADFILGKMRRNNRLLRRYRDGEAAIPGYLTDYSFLCWGLLELYEATFETRWLEEAHRLSIKMLDLFWDEEKGGLWFSARDTEQLLAKSKEVYDGAIPSGNSIAALVLSRLGKITDNKVFQTRSEEIFETFASDVKQNPRAYSQFLIGYDFALGPTKEIVIAGGRDQNETHGLLEVVRRRFLPRSLLLLHSADSNGEALVKLAPFIKEQNPLGGKPAVYVCENYACQRPVTTPDEFEKLL